MARGGRQVADPHTAAYRLGQQGRPLSGQLLRAAESDESILETWRSGKRDRPRARPKEAGTPGFGTEPPEDFDDDEGSEEEPPAARAEPREPSAQDLATANRRQPRATPSPRTPRPSSSKRVLNPLAAGSGHTYTHSAASLVLGAVAAALAINVVKYGPAGISMWFKAKFLNETSSSSGSAPTSAVAGGGHPVAQ